MAKAGRGLCSALAKTMCDQCPTIILGWWRTSLQLVMGEAGWATMFAAAAMSLRFLCRTEISMYWRYIYKLHRDTYTYIMKNSNLQVVVIDKLFHKYVPRGLQSSSKNRFKCNFLLQVSIYHPILPLASNYIVRLYNAFFKKNVPYFPNKTVGWNKLHTTMSYVHSQDI
jgi:hypothetical protein